MKIINVRAFPISIPQKKPFTTTRETMRQRDYVIVKVGTDDGITGIAEASTIDTWGEPQQACVHAIENILGPAIIGVNPFDVRKILFKMDRALESFWYSKSAIDVALYDIMGKALGVPVYSLLGGQFHEVIQTSRSVGVGYPEECIEFGKKLYDDLGSRTIKIKVGVNPIYDIAVVKGIREYVGPDVMLKVDFNQGYGDAKTAIEILKAMEPFNVKVAEQPVKSNDLDGMAKVTHAIKAHVAADESIWNARDVVNIYEKKAADVLTIYIVKSGGLTRTLEVAAVAKACNLPCILGGMGEMGIGSAALLHLATALENLAFPGDFHIPPYHLTDDILSKPLEYENDRVKIPQGPGLGVELDEDKLKKYATS